MKNKKRRGGYLLLSLVLLLTEIGIGRFVHDAFLRPYGGDILVVILIYCLIRVVIPTGWRRLPLYVFIFACAVEVLQYFDFVTLIGLGDNAVARTALGTSFSFLDILCYFVGCALVALVEGARKKP